MPEGNKMSNGLPPARPDDAINARWLFPQERAPSPPCDEGCKHNGLGDPALLSSKAPSLSEIAGCAACVPMHSLLPTMCLWMTALT